MYFGCEKLLNTFCGAFMNVKTEILVIPLPLSFCTWASCPTKRTFLPTASRPSLSFNSLSILLIKQQLTGGKVRGGLNPKPRKPRKQPSPSLRTTTSNFFHVCRPSMDRTLPIKSQNGRDSASSTSIRRQKCVSQSAVFKDHHSPFPSSG